MTDEALQTTTTMQPVDDTAGDTGLGLPRAINGYARPDTERLVAQLRTQLMQTRRTLNDQATLIDRLSAERDEQARRADRAEQSAADSERMLGELRHDYGALEERLNAVEQERDSLQRAKDKPLETWGRSLQQVADQADAYAKETRDNADMEAQRIVDAANKQANDIHDQAQTAYEQTREQAEQLTRDAQAEAERIRVDADAHRDKALADERDARERIHNLRSVLLDVAGRLEERPE